MLHVQEIDITRMRSATLSRFFGRIEELIKSIYHAETCEIAISFLESSQALELSMKGCNEEESASLQEADDLADDAWGSLHDQIKASLRHPNPEKQAAAAAVYMVFAEFSNPTRLNYDEEYEQIRYQISALRRLPARTLQLAYVDEYLDALEKSSQAFQDKLSSIRDSGSRSSENKKAREKSQDAYRQFATSLNVMLRISKDERFEQLATGLNRIIEEM